MAVEVQYTGTNTLTTTFLVSRSVKTGLTEEEDIPCIPGSHTKIHTSTMGGDRKADGKISKQSWTAVQSSSHGLSYKM